MTDEVSAPSLPAVTASRRTFLKAAAWGAGGIGLTSLLAACGGNAATSASGDTLILRMPFLADMQVPDPDIMYEGEGAQLMNAVYEGLAQYRPGSAEIIPRLADSWEISPDLLTYTFKLKPGVKFHDGSVADAEAWVKSFQRRKEINEGPAYMVAGVVNMEAPDPTTFVVTLDAPNNAFLHYMACPWHPFAVSPAAVTENAGGGDPFAQEWLKTHDAGTGPYVISEFVPGSHYLLERFDDYWGGEVTFEAIRIQIVPDVASQKLQLDQGAFEMVTKGLLIPDVLAYQDNDQFNVPVTVGGSGNAIWLNPNREIFADKALRQAFLSAVDRTTIVDTAFGGLVEPYKAMWYEEMFPPELVEVPWAAGVDTEPLKALVAALPDKNVDLGAVAEGGAPVMQMAELLQTQLAALGFEATVRQIPTAQVFDLVNQPQASRPDMMVAWLGGDALHLDTLLRILLHTDAKPLNLFSYSYPDIDALMDKATQQRTPEEMNAVYADITRRIIDEAIWVPLCATPAPIVAAKSITGIEQDSYYPIVVDASKLTTADAAGA
ncbi:MAG: ABC transporter substrate-binding protein [Mycobacterium sp.]